MAARPDIMRRGVPVPTVVAPYARRTTRLSAVVEASALALGGEGGARILAALGLAFSPDTLLNCIRGARRPVASAPRVIGIDDWSWRRGHRFGTIIVDLERHAVVDLLPDRAVESTVAWLQEHPEVATIARDRAGVYAEAASKGAPQAVQVADRWHLLHNLTEVLEDFLLHKRATLPAAADAAVPDACRTTTAVEVAAPTEARTPGQLTPPRPRHNQERLEEASRRRHARVVEQYAAIRRLHAAGADVADIARRVGTSRRTVYRYRDLPEPPEPKRPHRPARQRVLTPYEPYVLRHWQEGCHNGMRLYREIREQGYAYGASNVMRFVAQLRRDEADGQPAGAGARAKATRGPSARRVAGLFLRRPADLHPEQQAYLDRLLANDATLAAAYRLTQDFAAMVRERGGTRLDAWLAEADACAVPALQRFAKGLRDDRDAVRAGLTESWSNEYVAYCTSSPRSRPQAWLSSHAGSSVGGQNKQVPRSLYRSPRRRPPRYQRQIVCGWTPSRAPNSLAVSNPASRRRVYRSFSPWSCRSWRTCVAWNGSPAKVR